MSRLFAVVALAAALCVPLLIAAPLSAQDEGRAKSRGSVAPTMKVGKDQKLCQYRFPDGERRSWACDKEQPCCAWDEIKYVKCGSTITKCL